MTNFPHTTVIVETAEPSGKHPRGLEPGVWREFRWRVEMFDGKPRVVAEHRRRTSASGKWSQVRRPERLAQLLAMTPNCPTCGAPPGEHNVGFPCGGA